VNKEIWIGHTLKRFPVYLLVFLYKDHTTILYLVVRTMFNRVLRSTMFCPTNNAMEINMCIQNGAISFDNLQERLMIFMDKELQHP
jgi:hypothetical protein